MRGVIAAGHPLSAEAGAEILREGGNAVDAAVGAVLASFALESPLTGFGAGGFMMVHRGKETTLLDFFVAAPGKDRIARRADLVPIPVHFDSETIQTFYVGTGFLRGARHRGGTRVGAQAFRLAAAPGPGRPSD